MVGTIAVKLMCGISGSGKSTWAAKDSAYKEADGFTTAIISRDAVRFSMLKPGEEYFSKEKAAFNEFVRQINEAIELGINFVYVDQTSWCYGARRKIIDAMRPNTFTDLEIVWVDTDIETAVAQNAQRSGRALVPENTLRSMASKFAPPQEYELKHFESTSDFRHVTINHVKGGSF